VTPQERLFSADLFAADATAARARLTALQRENEVKKLGADLELKLRAIYFDVIRPESVEGQWRCDVVVLVVIAAVIAADVAAMVVAGLVVVVAVVTVVVVVVVARHR
jgi:hypothetical protein